VKVNLNQYVIFEMDEQGIDLLRQDYAKLKPPYEFTLPKKLDDGRYKMQMWDFMNTFGPLMFPGCRMPVGCDIEIVSFPH